MLLHYQFYSRFPRSIQSSPSPVTGVDKRAHCTLLLLHIMSTSIIRPPSSAQVFSTSRFLLVSLTGPSPVTGVDKSAHCTLLLLHIMSTSIIRPPSSAQVFSTSRFLLVSLTGLTRLMSRSWKIGLCTTMAVVA
jgi:hypothetical protein